MFAWRVAVGQALARLTHVALRPDGVLDVVVTDARWLRELERSSPMILERLRDLLGQDEVRRIGLTCPSNTRSDRRRPPKSHSR